MLNYNKETAIEKYSMDPANWDPVLFLSHNAEKDGLLRACMSQWWKCEFLEGSMKFSSAEQYMMYRKAILFNDKNIALKIMETTDPRECKELGREVKGFDSAIWSEHRFPVVAMGNLLKFSQNPGLASQLMSTGDRYIAEASYNDLVWGIGLSADQYEAKLPIHWKGLNLLGFALMRTRDCLRLERR